MPCAVIQGEVHTSRGDKSVAADRLDGVDALLRESMDQRFEHRLYPFYLVLFIGMKLFRNSVQRILYASDRPVFTLAAERDVAVHRMDISVADWADAVPAGKQCFIAGLSGIVTYGTVIGISRMWVQVVIGAVMFIMLCFLYAALLTIPERDTLMVDRITALADRNGYDTVLVSVGDAHIQGIAERLEQQGWDVDTYTSNTLLGRMLRPVMDALNRVLD